MRTSSRPRVSGAPHCAERRELFEAMRHRPRLISPSGRAADSLHCPVCHDHLDSA